MGELVAFDPAARRRNRRYSQPAHDAGTELLALIPSWRRALDAEEKSPHTLRIYTWTITVLAKWLAAQDLPVDAERIEADHIRDFLIAERERTSGATAGTHYRSLKAFWKWAIRERERTGPNPMDNINRPKTTKKAKTFFEDEQLTALLKTCDGTSLEERRDTAILRIFMDTGVRVSGMASIRYTPDNSETHDVDLTRRPARLRIVKKGGDELWIPLGRKAVAALDRYLRARAKHERADSQWLWLGVGGTKPDHFTASGIRQMTKRRGAMVGIDYGSTPHRFRRTFVDDYLQGGGTVDGVMAIAGWSSYAMVREYAGDRAAERARQDHQRLSPGDRI